MSAWPVKLKEIAKIARMRAGIPVIYENHQHREDRHDCQLALRPVRRIQEERTIDKDLTAHSKRPPGLWPELPVPRRRAEEISQPDIDTEDREGQDTSSRAETQEQKTTARKSKFTYEAQRCKQLSVSNGTGAQAFQRRQICLSHAGIPAGPFVEGSTVLYSRPARSGDESPLQVDETLFPEIGQPSLARSNTADHPAMNEVIQYW